MTGDIKKFSNFEAGQAKVYQQQSHQTLETVFPPCVSLKIQFSDDFGYNNNARVECTIIITNLIYNHQQDDAAISTIFSTILIVTSEEVRHGLTLLPLPPGGEDAPMA